jgi:hypothetical protein
VIRLAALFGLLAACAFDPTEIVSLTIENASPWSIATVDALACAGSGQSSLLADPLDSGATTTVVIDAGCYDLIATSAGDDERWTDVDVAAGSAALVWRLTTAAAQSHEPGCGGPPP